MADIIETLTQAASEEKQAEIHQARVQKYRDEGYAVVDQPDGSAWIYPKNALTGRTDMAAMPTKLWARPELTPDDTYEIPKPSDVEPDLSGTSEWDFVVRERPIEWQDPVSMEGTEFNSQYTSGQFK